MDILYFIAQIFGLLSLIMAIISIGSRVKSKYLIFNAMMNLFSSLQYILLGKIIGFLLCLINMFRVLVYYLNRHFNKLCNVLILIVFIIINIITSIFTYNFAFDIFPMIASFDVCITLWQNNIFVIRIGNLIAKVCWGIYAIYCRAIFSIIMDIILILWTLFVIIRENIKNKVEENKI